MRLYENLLHVYGDLVGLSSSLCKSMLTKSRGVIGPRRLWAEGSLYHSQVYALIAGALAPVVVFFLARRWPKSWLRNVNIPVFLNGPLFVPPGTGINYGSFFIVGGVFQCFLRRRKFAWWSKVRQLLRSNFSYTHESLVQLCHRRCARCRCHVRCSFHLADHDCLQHLHTLVGDRGLQEQYVLPNPSPTRR